MEGENPVKNAALQSRPSSSLDWDSTFRRIMSLTTHTPDFSSQPRANRFQTILEAVVPSRDDPTHTKVLAIVNALVENGAILPDECGGLYNALLERVAKYNSLNAQSNLDRLVQDVRTAVSEKERSRQSPSLGSLVALNAFYDRLPATVPRGQSDYLSFLSALRMLVSDVPQTDVYTSGPYTFFSSSRSGSQTVNLTKAFENLRPLWGVKATADDSLAVSSILTPNTRLLLLIVAPFTDAVNFDQDSYVGHLLTLYRETIGHTRVDEATFNEITSVSRALGEDDGANLQATLNFLLTNKRQKLPAYYQLSPEEEKVLRYVQQSVALYLMQHGVTAETALDMTSANMSPSYYTRHRFFINRLMDYLRRAALASNDYFTNVILNAHWTPPEGFYTGEFDIPTEEDSYIWDDVGESLDSEHLRKMKELERPRSSAPREEEDDAHSLSELGAAAPRLSVSTPNISSLNSRDYVREARDLFNNQLKNEDLDMSRIIDTMKQNWTPYASRQTRARDNDEDSLGGSGNPFGHLKPKGYRRL